MSNVVVLVVEMVFFDGLVNVLCDVELEVFVCFLCW